MYISQVSLKGFRNFKNANINFTRKSLIIGSNEIGKSNLLYALRLLLDRSLPEISLEPEDSDFYVHETTNEIEVIIKIEEVCEDCILSKLRERVSDDGALFLAYRASRNPSTGKKKYMLLAGYSLETLTEIENRFYLRVLNIKFMGSSRDLFAYIRQERKRLLQEAKENRSEEEIQQDNITLGRIEQGLESVEGDVRRLSYINQATSRLNTELKQLSVQNSNQDVVFDTGASDASQFVDNLKLASRVGGKSLAIGGDGRNNQIHLALWAGKHNVIAENDEDEPLEVSIFCIEEPEAHLHPHQQRKLAEYLSKTLPTQVIITSHSPQIACEFPPSSIIRLYNNGPDTLAAGNGSSPFIEAGFIEFGYRLSIIPAEAFFSSVVMLVEGPSDELFYKALARQIGVDLDNLNISILMVAGVGFTPYISLLRSLRIRFVVRTDNDIFKMNERETYRFAGVQRAIKMYRDFFDADEKLNNILEREALLQGFSKSKPPQKNLAYVQELIPELERLGIYLSNQDLEHDLQARLGDVIAEYFGISDDDLVVQEMQKRKATFMFSFLKQHEGVLNTLGDDLLAAPLKRCEEIAKWLEQL